MKKSRAGVIFILFLGTIFVWGAVLTSINTEPFVEINFFDVGQGDSILIEMPGSLQMLIDGGPSRDVVEKIAKEIPFFDRKIELVVLTHPDKDHIIGLFEVFEVFEVERVLMLDIEGEKGEKEICDRFKETVKKEGSKVIFAKQGQKISFPNEVYFLIFWPEEDFQGSDTNDFSIVGELVFGKTNFLFTGDISEKIEKILIFKGLNLKSDVLKVAHHGSKFSTSENFLKVVMPIVAVISVGKNNYGHPTKEVLERLEKYDIKTLRTDEHGDVKVITDGVSLKIQ